MANPYPTHLLDECTTGLCLFGAGFLGKNDSVHMKDRQFKDVIIVDTDTEKMKQMVKQSPAHWVFLVKDVTTWLPLRFASDPTRWDVVSVDPPLALIGWCVENIDSIARLAKKYVVLTTTYQGAQELENKGYDVIDIIERNHSHGVVLAVMQPPEA